ncbi:MAG: ATP-binding cassette domain-containing protein [Bdellovibrionales bacterium]|nr:ATP-binding cassette domain-containing protein [Bdellovibrionales bacterium]
MISVRNLHKRFGNQVVLDGISLDIELGQTLAIVGPSGVGKSVLLKLIMGIMEPDEGEVVVFGQNITAAKTEQDKNVIRDSLGVLFQSAALFDSLTVYENVAFPLEQRREKHSASEIHSRVVKMLEALDLKKFSERFPEEIPLGTRKRVGMARSLITEPKVLLFDEPNTGLDPLVGQEVYDLINNCREKWGFTGVVISHELPEVFQVSDRVAMLLNGKVVIDAEPEAFAASEDPAVQQFLYGRIDGPIKIQ